MTESDDEIYKKAYADEQERIRIEAIKEKAQEDAQLAALGLSPRQKKTRLGRWVQKKKLLLNGGDWLYADLTRQELEQRISEVRKQKFELIVEREKRRKQRLKEEREVREGKRPPPPEIHVNRWHPSDPNYDQSRIVVYPPGVKVPETVETLQAKQDGLEKELELRKRLDTY